ncbi:MAG: phosphoribosylamine--glycine ligase [Candidatus Cloacimonetes bacterium]|nr:phosphoribosylamine--glycine ligase [Candidatus Cloacimonadota bacterium]MBS3767738.1 phosphoribosylamine--glycine ligase [Candidatus Cloacimonadota bacterium]
MNIAIIGSGGREHAIYWKLNKSPKADKIYAIPGNGGIDNRANIDPSDFDKLKEFCEEKQIDIIFVGPEAYLAQGIYDYFENTKIKVFGPSQRATLLESSKIFAKQFMRENGVSTADFWEFEDKQEALDFAKKYNGNLVLKYDGLAAGKGVRVCDSMQDIKDAFAEFEAKFGEDFKFFFEEKLYGDELSILGFADGKNIKLFQPSQDHKQLLERDQGPNTGGMGAYCPVDFYDKDLLQKVQKEIIEPTMNGIRNEDFIYKGTIYFGIMVTKTGPKLLEYNVRLGDPEAEVILPGLDSDLLELVIATLNGKLTDFNMKFKPGYYADVVLVSGGYPRDYKKGVRIKGLNRVDPDILVFQAGTEKKERNLVTSGGRVLNIVAHGNTLSQALKKSYKACDKIEFENMYYRRDIGKRESLWKRKKL